MTEVKYVTRRSGVKLVNERHGIPLKKSRVDKASSLGRGPKAIAHYGPTELYLEEEFVRWALESVSKADQHDDTAKP
jgi:hypothetical protein